MPQGDRHQSKLLNRNVRNLSLGRWCNTLLVSVTLSIAYWGQCLPSLANTPSSQPSHRVANLVAQDPARTESQPATNSIDLSPEIINGSPVLQKWLNGIPDVMSDIKNDPSFRTRVKVGYSQYPSTGQTGGFHLAVDDVFIGKSGLSEIGRAHV